MDNLQSGLISLPQPHFVLPRFHLAAHQAQCCSVYTHHPATTDTHHPAATDGESVESSWALLGPLAANTRPAPVTRCLVSKRARASDAPSGIAPAKKLRG
ncbi:hypothetical protein C8R47DRAFT_1205108 [Mycena vitilis]|nr:hypothetical protein C8R47DRAFT_1205106 [Mycena vitilis]KAJ6518028.1 hypothetical protein C8R47DRAFT_1205108 [Mycena vitilis]